jgi:hypothetical protein
LDRENAKSSHIDSCHINILHVVLGFQVCMGVGGRPSHEKRIFWEDKHVRRKGQLEGKATHVREAGEAHMQGIPNDTRFRFFVMYCNG